MVKIRWDFVPCLLIGALLFVLVTSAGKKYAENAYEKWENQEMAQGEIGGEPSKDTPLVSSIKEMKENDVFYVLTKDTNFEMYHLFYDNDTYNALELPSGEVVCVKTNVGACRDTKGYGEKQTPVGKIISFDLPDTLGEQLKDERNMTFSDTSFYVDMNGSRLDYPNDSDIEFKFNIASLAAFLIGFVGSHMLGAKIGLLPPVFPRRKKGGS